MDITSPQHFASCSDDGVSDQTSDKDNSKPTFDFSKRTWREDLTLRVEGEKLYVSKTVLSLASPVFDRMFQSDFKEKCQTELELPGKKVSEMRDFLRSIYPGVNDCISEVNVYKLLPLAEEYQVTTLKARCENFLLSRLNNELPADDFKIMLQNAAEYNLQNLLDKFCEEVPEQSAKNVISDEIPLPSKAAIRILDKMMGRLEKISEKNAWLEVVYKYITSDFSRSERQKFEKYKGWKCKSLYIKLNVDDIRNDTPQTKRFGLFNESENCTITISSKYQYTSDQRLFVEISFLDATVEKSKITVHGRFVIINATSKTENSTFTFAMDFHVDKLKCAHQTNNINSLIDVSSGYTYYSCLDAEVHLLAKREETD